MVFWHTLGVDVLSDEAGSAEAACLALVGGITRAVLLIADLIASGAAIPVLFVRRTTN